MADSRISELTELASLAAGDEIPVVDKADTSSAASGTTKRVTYANLLASLALDFDIETLVDQVAALTAGQQNLIEQINAKSPLVHQHADSDVPGHEARIAALEAAGPPPGGGTTVTWADPTDTETVEGVINHVASATASVTTSGTVPESIVFERDGVQLNIDNTGPPWSMIFDTTAVADDDYTLTAKAYSENDGAGTLLGEDSITVTVGNPAPAFVSKRGATSPPRNAAVTALGQFNLYDPDFMMFFRFVLDVERELKRWYLPLILSGSSIGGRNGYAAGDGGLLQPKIYAVNQGTGLPIMGTVLAHEDNVGGVARHNAAVAAFPSLASGGGVEALLWYFNFAEGNVTFDPDTMYAVGIRNTHANPGAPPVSSGAPATGNHPSVDCNWYPLSDAGPNGENTLDTSDHLYAVGGLDPRETTMWSEDQGSTIQFSDQIGWYGNGDGNMKQWHGHGYRTSDDEDIGHGVPGMIWPGSRVCTIRWEGCPRDATIVQAGGFGSSALGALGTVTLTNLRSGQVSRAFNVNSGSQGGILDTPFEILTGDSITQTATGAVELADAHSFHEVYGIGERLPYHYTLLAGASDSDADMPALHFKDANGRQPWYA